MLVRGAVVWWAYSSCISLTAPRVGGSNPRRFSFSFRFVDGICILLVPGRDEISRDAETSGPQRQDGEDEKNWEKRRKFESGMDTRNGSVRPFGRRLNG